MALIFQHLTNFFKQQLQVHAITGFHLAELNEASARLIKDHRTSLKNEKYLSQVSHLLGKPVYRLAAFYTLLKVSMTMTHT